METFLVAETLIIELLLIVSLVAIVVRRLRVPYTVALVLAGSGDHGATTAPHQAYARVDPGDLYAAAVV